MGTKIADRIDHFGAKHRGRQPAIERARFAVLTDHQPVDWRTEFALHQFNRFDVIDTQHLPLGAASRRADRRGGGDECVISHFIHGH